LMLYTKIHIKETKILTIGSEFWKKEYFLEEVYIVLMLNGKNLVYTVKKIWQ
jgi:hypothetical protein